MSQDADKFLKERLNLLNHMKKFKTHAANIVPIKEKELESYKNFAKFLEKFESNQKSSMELSCELLKLEKNIKNVDLISGDAEGSLKKRLELLTEQ